MKISPLSRSSSRCKLTRYFFPEFLKIKELSVNFPPLFFFCILSTHPARLFPLPTFIPASFLFVNWPFSPLKRSLRDFTVSRGCPPWEFRSNSSFSPEKHTRLPILSRAQAPLCLAQCRSRSESVLFFTSQLPPPPSPFERAPKDNADSSPRRKRLFRAFSFTSHPFSTFLSNDKRTSLS